MKYLFNAYKAIHSLDETPTCKGASGLLHRGLKVLAIVSADVGVATMIGGAEKPFVHTLHCTVKSRLQSLMKRKMQEYHIGLARLNETLQQCLIEGDGALANAVLFACLMTLQTREEVGV